MIKHTDKTIELMNHNDALINKVMYMDSVAYERMDGESGYTPTPPHFETNSTYFETLDDCEISFWYHDSDGVTNKLSYTTDGSNWSDVIDNTPISVPKGGQIAFKGNLKSSNQHKAGQFIINGRLNLKGNALSLIYGDDIEGKTSLIYESIFQGLFVDCPIVDASEFLLPSTSLTRYCYQNMFRNCKNLTAAPQILATSMNVGSCNQMFYGCSSLKIAPQLLATTLNDDCYGDMFYGCTSLEVAPQLLATTLPTLGDMKGGCYQGMFQGCTSLTTAPILPANTLTKCCYQNMFYGCSSLNNITMLATTTNAENCLKNWVRGVAVEGTFYKSQGKSLPSGDNGIPNGWTVIDYTE